MIFPLCEAHKSAFNDWLSSYNSLIWHPRASKIQQNGWVLLNILVINRLFLPFCVQKKSVWRRRSEGDAWWCARIRKGSLKNWFLPTHDKSYNSPRQFILSWQSRSIINPHKQGTRTVALNPSPTALTHRLLPQTSHFHCHMQFISSLLPCTRKRINYENIK